MSCSTTTAPCAAPDVAGAARTMIVRAVSRGGDISTDSGVCSASAAPTRSVIAG